VAWRKCQLFTHSKCPDCLPWGYSPGRPGLTERGERGPPALGYSYRFGQRCGEQLPLSRWAALGPRASCHLQLRAPLLGKDRSEITSSPERAGRKKRGGARESQASGGQDSGFLPRPGNTRGTPGLPRDATLRVWTRVHPRGRFPGARGASAVSGCRAAPASGAPPLGGLRAQEGQRAPVPGFRSHRAPASGAQCPWTPRAAAALPTPWPRRRPAPGGVNKRRTRFDLARPGFLAGVPPEQVTPWEGWKLVSGIRGQRH
jgi:hypothetical protein